MKPAYFFPLILLLLAGLQRMAASDTQYLAYQRILAIDNDSLKCARLISYANKMADSLNEYEFATLIFEKANAILKDKNYPKLQLNLYYCWGYVCYMKGSYETADKLFIKALSFKILDKDPAGKANILNVAGVNLQNLMVYKRALLYYNEALKLYSDLNDIKGKGKIYQNMANIFAMTGNLAQSDQFFDKAIKVFRENNMMEGYSISLGNKAYIKWKVGSLDTAKILVIRSLAVDINQITDFATYVDKYLNLGLIYCELKQWDSCFYALDRGKEIGDSVGVSERIDGPYYYNAGYCYVQKGDIKKGIIYYKKALKIKNGIADYRGLYDNIANLYYKIGQYDTAFLYKNYSLKLADSIYKSELKEHVNFENKRIELLERDYQNQIRTAEQQQFMNNLKKRNYLLVSLVFMLVALVVSLFLYFRQYRLKIKKEHLQSELDFLKAQMNPHFLFNSINNIYVLMCEDQARASHILLKFSELLRYQLYECNVSTITLGKELQFLENYIEFEKLRYSEKIVVQYNFRHINAGQLHIAPLLLQPFIENAFKHTPKNKHKQSSIHIHTFLEGNVLYFEVKNTIQPDAPSNLPGGVGLDNVKRRLNLLYFNKYELSITPAGTLYTIKLKLSLAND